MSPFEFHYFDVPFLLAIASCSTSSQYDHCVPSPRSAWHCCTQPSTLNRMSWSRFWSRVVRRGLRELMFGKKIWWECLVVGFSASIQWIHCGCIVFTLLGDHRHEDQFHRWGAVKKSCFTRRICYSLRSSYQLSSAQHPPQPEILTKWVFMKISFSFPFFGICARIEETFANCVQSGCSNTLCVRF